MMKTGAVCGSFIMPLLPGDFLLNSDKYSAGYFRREGGYVFIGVRFVSQHLRNN